VGGACGAHGTEEKFMQVFLWISGRHERRWEYTYIKITRNGCHCVDCIRLAEDRDMWLSVLQMVMVP
jgi:hypothetical protein